MSSVRTIEDLERAIRAIATHFKCDAVVIIGSQAIMFDWPDAPALLRTSGEIDIYPGNWLQWEKENLGIIASEEISALLGQGSQFHLTHGFYLDGVDERTAIMPRDWKARARVLRVDAHGASVTGIAPDPYDLVVSKLFRLDEKDCDFIREYHRHRPLSIRKLRRAFESCDPDPDLRRSVQGFLSTLA